MAPRAPRKADEGGATPPKKTSAAAKKTAATAAKATTPRKRTTKPRVLHEVTADDIAFRAYMISISGEGGDQLENWLRAEQELRPDRGVSPGSYPGVA